MDLSVHLHKKNTFQPNETLLQACDDTDSLDDPTHRRMRCLRAVSRSITHGDVVRVADGSTTDSDDESDSSDDQLETSFAVTAADDASSEVYLFAPHPRLALVPRSGHWHVLTLWNAIRNGCPFLLYPHKHAATPAPPSVVR